MKKSSKKLPTKHKPWSGTHAVEMQLHLPSQFMMLCHLLEVSAEQVLHDFISTAGMESYSPGKEQQNLISEYLLRCSYGQHHYTAEDIRQMIEELRAISTLWPDGGSPEVINRHSQWRSMYHEYWFKKWYEKNKRISSHHPTVKQTNKPDFNFKLTPIHH